MINYRKIERIAAELEKSLGIQDQIDERVEKEQERTDAPVPSLEASKTCLECGQENCICEKQKKQARVAHLTRLVKLAKAVKKSTKMTAKEKEEALEKIEKASKIGMKRTDFSRQMTTTTVQNIKQISKANEALGEIKGMTLNDMLEDAKKMKKENPNLFKEKNGNEITFPNEIKNLTIGRCKAAWLAKIGPMITNMIETYQKLKKAYQEDNQ